VSEKEASSRRRAVNRLHDMPNSRCTPNDETGCEREDAGPAACSRAPRRRSSLMWISEYSKHESRAGGRATSGRPLSASACRREQRLGDRLRSRSRKAAVGNLQDRVARAGPSPTLDSSKSHRAGHQHRQRPDSGQPYSVPSSTRPIAGGRSDCWPASSNACRSPCASVDQRGVANRQRVEHAERGVCSRCAFMGFWLSRLTQD